MKQLLTEVRATIDAELTRAQLNHGTTYHSPHEGYGVLAEELEEAKTEHDHVRYLQTMLLNALRLEDSSRLIDLVEDIGERATLAACEYIQVAAVTQKMIATLRGGKA